VPAEELNCSRVREYESKFASEEYTPRSADPEQEAMANDCSSPGRRELDPLPLRHLKE
jgi:hypothetical protein